MVDEDMMESDSEALYSMLIAWYMSGYHTGYYQVRKNNVNNCYTQTYTLLLSTFFSKSLISFHHSDGFTCLYIENIVFRIRDHVILCGWN